MNVNLPAFNSTSTIFQNDKPGNGLPDKVGAKLIRPGGVQNFDEHLGRYYDMAAGQMARQDWVEETERNAHPDLSEDALKKVTQEDINNVYGPSNMELLRAAAFRGSLALVGVSIIFGSKVIPIGYGVAKRETTSGWPSLLGVAARRAKQHTKRFAYPSISDGPVVDDHSVTEAGADDSEELLEIERAMAKLVALYNLANQLKAHKFGENCIYLLKEEPDNEAYYRGLGYDEKPNDIYNSSPAYLKSAKDDKGNTIRQHLVRLWAEIAELQQLIEENMKSDFGYSHFSNGA